MAGVSVATVSHVINNTRHVSDATRSRVLECVRRLDYSPDQMARSFKTGRTHQIGFIAPDIANIFFARVIEEVEGVIGREGYRLIVCNTRETQAREKESIRMLANGMVDGLLIASTLDRYQQLEGVLPAGLPCVFLDRNLPDCPRDVVTIANYQAVYRAVEELIRAGHQRIGYITGLPRLSTTQERYSAYRDAMEARGLPIQPRFVCAGNSMRSEAERHVRTILQAGCTALIVSNHMMTDDVLFSLSEQPLRERIAVVGYNDSDYPSYGTRHIYTV